MARKKKKKKKKNVLPDEIVFGVQMLRQITGRKKWGKIFFFVGVSGRMGCLTNFQMYIFFWMFKAICEGGGTRLVSQRRCSVSGDCRFRST